MQNRHTIESNQNGISPKIGKQDRLTNGYGHKVGLPTISAESVVISLLLLNIKIQYSLWLYQRKRRMDERVPFVKSIQTLKAQNKVS